MDIAVEFKGGRTVEAAVHGFTITTDQPPAAGGSGSAPAPFDLFLASLATCAGFYVFDFCIHRNISTDGVRLVMHTKTDAEKHLVGHIGIEIILPAGFPEKYEKAVVRAAELCSVKRHLHEPPAIDTYTTRST